MLDPNDEDQLSRFSDVISERMGLSFPRERWTDLDRGSRAAAAELGFNGPGSPISWFLSDSLDKRTTEILASHLTIGETYFFRDVKSFRALEDQILPTLVSSRRHEKRLRIWSAGCCTGEEPYSIGILLHSMLRDFKEWTITLLATDINPRFLRKASEAVYGDWSFREAPEWVKGRYFTERKKGRFELIPAIRRMVTFAPINLVDDSYPSILTNTNAMDLVLCRNVLMYFLPRQARRVVDKLSRVLVHSGWLLVSPTEMSAELFQEFDTVQHSSALSYRKRTGQPQRVLEIVSPLEETATADVRANQLDQPKAARGVPSPTRPSTDVPTVDVETKSKKAPPLDVLSTARDDYARGNVVQATYRIVNSLSTHPNDAPLLSLLARILAGEGKLTEAEIYCRKAIQVDKLNDVYRYLLATILHEEGRNHEAINSLQKSLYLNPDSLLSHFLLANLESRNGKPDKARKHFRETLRLLVPYRQDEVLPESDGMTAGRLREIIHSAMQPEETT